MRVEQTMRLFYAHCVHSVIIAVNGYLLNNMVKMTMIAMTMMQPTMMENHLLGVFSCGCVCFWFMMLSRLCACGSDRTLDIFH